MLISCSNKLLLHSTIKESSSFPLEEYFPENYMTSNSMNSINRNISNATNTITNKTKITYCVFNHNDQIIACGTNNGDILFLNQNLEKISNIKDNDFMNTTITNITFTSNSYYIAYSNNQNTIKIFDLKQNKIFTKINIEEDQTNTNISNIPNTNTFNNKGNSKNNISSKNTIITSLIFTNDNKSLIYSTSTGRIYITHFSQKTTSSSNLVTSESNLNMFPESLLFSNYFKINIIKISPFFNNLLACALETGGLKLFDIDSFEEKFDFKEAHDDSITGVAFSPINKMLLVSVSIDKRINFYDIILNKLIKTFDCSFPILSLSFYLDGKTIACGGIGGHLSIFDLSMGKEEKLILEGHDDNVICVNFSFTNKNWKINLSKKRSNNIEREIIEESKEQVFTDTEENIAANSSINKENKERNIIKGSSSNYNKINTNSIGNNNGNGNPELISNKNKNTNTNMINSNNNLKMNSQLNNIHESVNEYDYSNNYSKSLKKKENNIEIQNNTNTIKNNNNDNDTDTNKDIKVKSSLNYLEYVKFKQDNNIQTNSIINNNENSLKSNNKDNRDTKDYSNGNLNIMANKINNNTEIIRTNLEKMIKEEFKSMKSFIHEEIKQVHLDMIRQFQLQEMNIINEIRNSVALNHALKKELKLVKKENNEIKNNYFN